MKYVLILIAYLVGSIPWSIIIGKTFKGIDIRQHGSGNPGTTNAIRVLGRKIGMIVFLLDVLKGGFIILLIRLGLFENFTIFHPLLYGLISAIGHIYPVFLKFKGGKAVATGVGIFLFYAPLLGVIGLLGYIVTLKVTRYVSISSCMGTVSLFVAALVVFFFGPEPGSTLEVLFGPQGELIMPIISFIGLLLIFYRHRGNFKNIMNKVEPKSNFLQKKKL
ncbi:glycerol-3-phosphate 1-O-acyltransferase PlsY [Liberiplasma polymorphum]|uniref:glycerol-3-phosphate 1-O-acyltransferase PlsY n=1 Tax=Liberiplasma polymorphum TaxID=3374570 RepID=UPI003775A97E